jgi:hypothetical protein
VGLWIARVVAQEKQEEKRNLQKLRVFGARGGIACEAGKHRVGKKRKKKGKDGMDEEEECVSNIV